MWRLWPQVFEDSHRRIAASHPLAAFCPAACGRHLETCIEAGARLSSVFSERLLATERDSRGVLELAHANIVVALLESLRFSSERMFLKQSACRTDWRICRCTGSERPGRVLSGHDACTSPVLHRLPPSERPCTSRPNVNSYACRGSLNRRFSSCPRNPQCLGPCILNRRAAAVPELMAGEAAVFICLFVSVCVCVSSLVKITRSRSRRLCRLPTYVGSSTWSTLCIAEKGAS